MSGRRRLLSGQGGFALTEHLVVLAVGLTAFGATLFVVDAVNGTYTRQASRLDALNELRPQMDRLVREIRFAQRITATGAQTFTARVWSRTAAVATTRDVKWDCSVPSVKVPGAYRCTRQDLTAGTAAVTMVDGLTNTNQFTWSTTSRFVEIRLRQNAKGNTRPVTLRDGVSLRTCRTASLLSTECAA
ncbi:type II secretion system protein J [Conexibacter sp. SYSU D00693]|uniref:PulJ/GspJ family protein n=1 Tax=Conexibacter sp. SYSU D00693 TaxID=2812560 RepID=UPI00196B1753|nr:hypothetical protein [Conexibacter sp. SYSU D00693]